MRNIAVIGLMSFVLVACSSQQPTHADPTGGAVSDTDGIIARFTNDIWPAINAKNGVVAAQGGPEDRQFHHIVDKGAYPDDAVLGLGQASRDSVMSGNPYRDPAVGLRLGSVAVTALNPPMATLKVCYTYSLVNQGRTTPPQPAASEITVELHKTDAWYLRSITDDHVVPGCEGVNS